jgi:uncharacterized protein with HEPN domain
MKAMRNFAAHNYAKLDLEVLWSTIKFKIIDLYDKAGKTATPKPQSSQASSLVLCNL